MRNKKKLVLEQLDRKLKPFKGLENVPVPPKGWIHGIRTALNMTLEQLGKRLSITRQGVGEIQRREVNESIKIKDLQEFARAMDMTFVYGFVPNSGSLDQMVEHRSRKLAKKIVLRTNHNMLLENQGNDMSMINQAIEDLTQEIKREVKRSIWD